MLQAGFELLNPGVLRGKPLDERLKLLRRYGRGGLD
jgi:hypothetical protein